MTERTLLDGSSGQKFSALEIAGATDAVFQSFLSEAPDPALTAATPSLAFTSGGAFDSGLETSEARLVLSGLLNVRATEAAGNSQVQIEVSAVWGLRSSPVTLVRLSTRSAGDGNNTQLSFGLALINGAPNGAPAPIVLTIAAPAIAAGQTVTLFTSSPENGLFIEALALSSVPAFTL